MTCVTLPAPAHALLGLLTMTARRRKHAQVIMTGPGEWAAATGLTPSEARNWRDDLLDWGVKIISPGPDGEEWARVGRGMRDVGT